MSLLSLKPALRLVTRSDAITQPLNQCLSTGASTVRCQASTELANAATVREPVRTPAANSISNSPHGTSKPNDDVSVTRRAVLSSLALLPALDSLFGSGNGGADVALARERRTRIDIPEEMYQEGEGGLRFYDVAVGKGTLAERGDPVVVHFDVTYRSLTVVSSRQSKLLGGNRVISQVCSGIISPLHPNCTAGAAECQGQIIFAEWYSAVFPVFSKFPQACLESHPNPHHHSPLSDCLTAPILLPRTHPSHSAPAAPRPFSYCPPSTCMSAH
ncbi:unnamed protein product [Closterium sp. NIES-54]